MPIKGIKPAKAKGHKPFKTNAKVNKPAINPDRNIPNPNV
jgi:hypothetical protein